MGLTVFNNRAMNRRIEVIGENTGLFHGMRAYFEGRYLRVRKLDEEDLEELLRVVPEGGTVEE